MSFERDLTNWLLGTFAVSNVSRGEFQFPCPRCNHPAFYFNVSKKIGFCHRDTCHWKPGMVDLTALVGHTPHTAGYIPSLDNSKQVVIGPVTLPKGCKPITEDEWMLEVLSYRFKDFSVLARVRQHDIHSDRNSIIIPIIDEDGNLVQYVRRFVNRRNIPSAAFSLEPGARRYDYFSGVPVTNYLFHWSRHKKYSIELTLVENTFNAMYYNYSQMPVSTNFGSHLSDAQVSLIVKSRVKTLVLMWDEGAKTTKAIQKLRTAGVRAAAVNITGQPDDHPYTDIADIIQATHEKLRSGTF